MATTTVANTIRHLLILAVGVESQLTAAGLTVTDIEVTTQYELWAVEAAIVGDATALDQALAALGLTDNPARRLVTAFSRGNGQSISTEVEMLGAGLVLRARSEKVA